jgi:hypothetical protein
MAHTSPLSDPIALFQAALDAIGAEDWRAAALLCDPVSLRHFHGQILAQFAPAVHEIAVEDLLRHDPEMPREAAEYEVARHRKASDAAARLRHEIPRVASLAELRELSPAEAFAGWLEERSFRRQLEQRAAAGERAAMKAAQLPRGASVFALHLSPLGAVTDGERVTHVLYRHAIDENAAWPGAMVAMTEHLPADQQVFVRELWQRGRPEVATCRLQPDGTWGLIAGYNFLGMGSRQIVMNRNAGGAPGPQG